MVPMEPLNIRTLNPDNFNEIENEVQDWNGYACLILTEDSVSCENINNYIESHWENLNERSGNDLLIFAIATPGLSWLENAPQNNPTLELRKEIFTAYQDPLYKKYQMSKIHKFVRRLENEKKARNGQKEEIKLPSLAFFNWDAKACESLKRRPDPDNQIKKINLYTLEFPDAGDGRRVEGFLFDIIEIACNCREENKEFAAFIEKVKWNRDVKLFKSSARKLGGLFNTIYTYVRPIIIGA